jgi:Uma2 family endonuclease
MASASYPVLSSWTLGDLATHFGALPYGRIRHDPPPGSATEQDVIAIHDRENRLYELVEGVLVEKTMGTQESWLGGELFRFLAGYVAEHELGFVLPADGMTRLAPGLVRIPDVSFVSWSRVPRREIPHQPILDLAPDLAVEVLSPGNTPQEMRRKLRDYFSAGVQEVWYVDPQTRSVTVFRSAKRSLTLREGDELGSRLLPGFSLPLKKLFARLPRKSR